jgi:hypothetical protein
MRIVRNHLLVDREAGVVESFLGDAAVDAERLDRVDDHQVPPKIEGQLKGENNQSYGALLAWRGAVNQI